MPRPARRSCASGSASCRVRDARRLRAGPTLRRTRTPARAASARRRSACSCSRGCRRPHCGVASAARRGPRRARPLRGGADRAVRASRRRAGVSRAGGAAVEASAAALHRVGGRDAPPAVRRATLRRSDLGVERAQQLAPGFERALDGVRMRRSRTCRSASGSSGSSRPARAG